MKTETLPEPKKANQTHWFLKEVNDLMKMASLGKGCLSAAAMRITRANRSATLKTFAAFAREIWKLQQDAQADQTHADGDFPEKMRRFWASLGESLNAGKPLSPDIEETVFVRLFCVKFDGNNLPDFMPPPATSARDLIPPFQTYLHNVAKKSRELVTRGIALGDMDATMRLVHVYAQLETQSYPPPNEAELENPGETKKPLSALEVLFDPETSRVVLVGEPGSGKSTFFQYVTFCLSEQLSCAAHNSQLLAGVTMPALLQKSSLIPLRIILQDFASDAKNPGKSDSDAVVSYLRNQLELNGCYDAVPVLKELLKSGAALILFDGLDEVPKSQLRQVRQAITAFASGDYKACRIAVTCRAESYKLPDFKLDDFPAPHQLARLTTGLRDAFVASWYRELVIAHPQFDGEVGSTAESLLNALNTERLGEMSLNPFFLTVMAALHRPDKPLPDTGAKLMDELVTGILTESRKQRSTAEPNSGQPELVKILQQVPNGPNLLRSRLEAIAYLAREKRQDQGSRFVDDDLLRNRLSLNPSLPAGWSDGLLEALKHRAGLLQYDDKKKGFEFAYRFEEFLAGCYLTNDDHWQDEPSLAKRCKKLFKTQGENARQVILWAAGFNAHVRNRWGTVRELVSSLIPNEKSPLDDHNLARLDLAVDIAHDAGMEKWLDDDVPDAPATIEKLRTALEQVSQGKTFKIVEKSRAASAIGRLGDARKSVIFLPENGEDMDFWIQIAAGRFEMGSKEKEHGGKMFKCDCLQKNYKISRYPITVAQYQKFIDEKGYADNTDYQTGGFWTSAGIRWREFPREVEKEKVEERENLRHELDPKEALPKLRDTRGKARNQKITGPENYDVVFQTPNHPRVGVSWFEAAAFCRWLGKKLKLDIRLPSEAEWERAARGQAGRPYPWGHQGRVKDLAERCNCAHTKLNQTSAVGLFRAGNTPREPGNKTGLSDMSGNVWEWCRTLWGKDRETAEFRYPYNPGDGREVEEPKDSEKFHRVLRGSAWYYDGSESFRGSRHCRDFPYGRFKSVGFRIVCLGPSSL